MTNGPCTIREEDLDFTFDTEWTNLLKWDDTAAYRSGLRDQIVGSRAVDFVGIRDGNLYLIEVKDYRGSERTPSTRKKLRDGGTDLIYIAAAKVRDSVAGIVGTAHLDRDAETATLARGLINPTVPVWVVLWIEHAASLPSVKPSVQALRNKARGGIDTDRLQAAVRWLGAHTLICARGDHARIPGITVVSIPGAKRRLPHLV